MAIPKEEKPQCLLYGLQFDRNRQYSWNQTTFTGNYRNVRLCVRYKSHGLLVFLHSYCTAFSVPQYASPEWATVVVFEHTPGTEHRIAVDIFHSHSGEKCTPRNTNTQEHRGTLVFEDATQLCGLLMDVETILSHRDQTLVERIPGSGRLIVRLEECSPGDSREFKFHLRGLDIQNTRRIMLERPSLYFEIRRKQKGKVQDTWSLVYRSKCAQPSLNPHWDCDVVSLASLVNGDVHREIRISV